MDGIATPSATTATRMTLASSSIESKTYPRCLLLSNHTVPTACFFQLAFDALSPQVARLRGGIKRATAVKADEEDTDADEDEDGGAGIVSGLKDNIKDVGPLQVPRGCCGC